MIKYFVVALDMLTRDETPTLEAVYARTRHPRLEFKDGLSLGTTLISHNPLPGFTGSAEARSSGWAALAECLGSLDYLRAREPELAAFALSDNPDARIVFVYRNPFDLFVAYARRYADMVGDLGAAGVMPTHALMPIVHPPFVADEDPLLRFLGRFRESQFFESYLLHYLPYHVMRDRFPGRLALVSYESLMASREAELRKMISFLGGVATPDQIRAATRFTEIDRMREYESHLGHSLSGERYFFGAAKQTHITRTRRVSWRDALNPAAVVYAERLFEDYGLDIRGFQSA